MTGAALLAVAALPAALPFAAGPLAARAAERLRPRTALWFVTLAAVLLGASVPAALGTLVATGLLRVPAVAAFGELVRPLPGPADRVLAPVAGVCLGLLALGAGAFLRRLPGQFGALRRARAAAERGPAAGDLCIVDSPRPDAFALPGRPHRIVVTTAMLEHLGPAEREALFAHERAHNAGRHHLFLAAAELAAHCHPGLRPARTAIRFAVERCADEAAAAAVGDRRLTARAIARAALASGGSGGRPERPGLAAAATGGPVPRRVAALLSPPRSRPRGARWIAGALAACAVLSAGTAGTGLLTLHEEVEVAQGESAG